MEYRFSTKAQGGGGSAIEEILKYAGDPSVISLAGGNPATETFPSKELAEIARELLLEQPDLALQYNTPRGYAPFRELLTSTTSSLSPAASRPSTLPPRSFATRATWF